MRPLRRTFLIATVIGLVDAFVFNEGVIAVVVASGALVAGVSRAIAALVDHDRPAMRLRFSRTGIYVAMAIVVIYANVANGRMARRGADVLIAACRQYEARHGRLPDRLEDLVPEFILSVPAARYTLNPQYNHFSYFYFHPDVFMGQHLPGRHTLGWDESPPFMAPYYVFEEKRWATSRIDRVRHSVRLWCRGSARSLYGSCDPASSAA